MHRYFTNRDALLADLVVDAYNELADSLVAIEQSTDSAVDHLAAVLNGSRAWALEPPNAYRLIFQTSIGSGQEFAAERTVPAASRSMAVEALAAVTMHDQSGIAAEPTTVNAEISEALRTWATHWTHRRLGRGVDVGVPLVQLEPTSVGGGRLRARDRKSAIERTLPFESIAGISSPE